MKYFMITNDQDEMKADGGMGTEKNEPSRAL